MELEAKIYQIIAEFLFKYDPGMLHSRGHEYVVKQIIEVIGGEYGQDSTTRPRDSKETVEKHQEQISS